MIIAALVGVTYAFVTNVPQSPATTSTTIGTSDGATTTTTSEPGSPDDTTTTTLDPDTAEFVSVVAELAETGTALSDRAGAINAAWEDESATFSVTRDELRDLISETRQFATALDITTVPVDVEEAWVDVVAAAEEMASAADEMLDGLVNSPGPEQRQTALVDYGAAAESLQDALDAAVSAAGG